MPVLVLFGPTGAGKTFIGKALEKEFGYFFYDGDADLTDEMRTALNSFRVITDRMRSRFITRLINLTVSLSRQHEKVVIAQTFMKEKYREGLLKRLPQAKFVLVKTNQDLRHIRRRERADYPWDEAYVKKMDAIFEPPQIPHLVFTNDDTGTNNLKSDLRRLLSRLGGTNGH
jgi:gluconate kinase